MAQVVDNPKRPPKVWWNDCVRSVRESGGAQDPESVCGALWYKKLSARQRRLAIRQAERSEYRKNPEGELWLVTAYDRQTGEWLDWQGNIRKRELAYEYARNMKRQYPNSAVKVMHMWDVEPAHLRAKKFPVGYQENPAGAGTALVIGALAVGAWWLFFRKDEKSACPIEMAKLSRWGIARGLYVVNLFAVNVPPATGPLFEAFPEAGSALQLLVVVTADGSFWQYAALDQPAVQVPVLKQDYCEFT